jgi:thiamine biosynthesis lipoprotein
MLEIIDGAVATSATHARTARIDGRVWGVHIHGRSRKPVRGRRAVSVVAASCCTADALTKVMLADLRTGKRLLRRHQASACLHDEGRGWRMFGDS